MNKVVLSGIIIVIIIGIVSILYTSTLVENINEGIESTPISPEETSEEESTPQGRNLSIEFDEKIGLSAP
ncbi:MAG TPA: hypothetical protein VH562_02170 [Nitrosopumilaceae archaeon]|jgi:hypothetical protein